MGVAVVLALLGTVGALCALACVYVFVLGAGCGRRDGFHPAAEDDRQRSDAREERYRRIVETAPAGIAQTDRQGRIVLANRGLAQMLGYTVEELLGRSLVTFIAEQEHDTRRARDAARRPGVSVATHHAHHAHHALPLRHKSGAAVWALISTAPLRDAAGHLLGSVTLATDISARKRREAHLERLAHHDALTGLPNRVLLADRLEQALRTAARAGQECALLLVDLDGFKAVNDTWGHAVGDLLLRALAARLQGALRAADTVARLGGDEFAVLLPAVGAEGALTTAGKLAAALAAPVTVAGRPLVVGGSIGVACYPDHAGAATPLLRCADAAMYAAKRAGGGVAVYASGDVASGAEWRVRTG